MIRRDALFLVFATVGLGLAGGCTKPPRSETTAHADSSAAAKPSAAPVVGELRTAQEVLDKMTAAYKNAATYSDRGRVELTEPGAAGSRQADFSVAFERPNKLRLNVYQGEVVCDGKKWFGFSKDIPDQAVLGERAENNYAFDASEADQELGRGDPWFCWLGTPELAPPLRG